MKDFYFHIIMAAFIRGRLAKTTAPYLNDLSDLSEEDFESLFNDAKEEGLKVHKFKRTMGLARVQKILGILQGIQPESLLDVGSGRGAFLWPFLNTFPNTPVQCVDILAHRVRDLKAVKAGGYEHLNADLLDIRELPFEDNSFDISTALEVLEHVPQVERAVKELVRVSRRFIVMSVPSKEDENPEHIHLFDQARFLQLFSAEGIHDLKFNHVLNHMIIIAKL